MREGDDDNDDDASDDGDYGYDNDKAGETGDKNNADDYGTHPAHPLSDKSWTFFRFGFWSHYGQHVGKGGGGRKASSQHDNKQPW